MKRFFLIGWAVILFLSPGVARPEVTDRIVAIVNDDIVTLRDVERFVVVEKKSRYLSMNEYTRNLKLREKLDAFIDDVLIAQQAKKMKIEVTDKEVQDTIDNIKKQNLISDEELKEQLRNSKIDYKEFVDGVKKGLIRQRVLQRAVMQEVSLDEKALKAYYDGHKDDFADEGYTLQHIFISAQRSDAAERAKEAKSELDEGRSFEAVAKAFSDDAGGHPGDVVTMKTEELIPELREAIGLLIPGTYSNVVQTPFGYHIVKLIEAKKGAVPPFESLKDTVKAKFFQIESERRYKTFIAKLRASSYIEVKI